MNRVELREHTKSKWAGVPQLFYAGGLNMKMVQKTRHQVLPSHPKNINYQRLVETPTSCSLLLQRLHRFGGDGGR